MQENKITEQNIKKNIEEVAEQKEEKKKKKNFIIIILLLLLLLLGCHSCSRMDNQQSPDHQNVSAYILGDGFSPGLSEEELREIMQKKIDASRVAFSVYTKPIFNGKRGTIMFGNPKHNMYDLKLEVTVDDEVVIKTENVPPDKYIAEIETTKELKKGQHKGDARVTAYDRETGELTGEIAIDMILTVQ